MNIEIRENGTLQEMLAEMASKFETESDRAYATLQELKTAQVCLSLESRNILRVRGFNGSGMATALRTALTHLQAITETGTAEERREVARLGTLAVLKAKQRAKRAGVTLVQLEDRLAV
jgi:hypothetical protein